MKENYLFGPFVGETTYELNYFVGHAIFLRKKKPKNRIIVLTRKENFDLYGKYATTLIPLPMSKDLKPKRFGCENLRVSAYDEITRKFKSRYKNDIKIHAHFYPHLSSYLRDLKWYYPRNEIDFDFKPRAKNAEIADDLIMGRKNIVFSEFYLDFEKVFNQRVIPYNFILEGIGYLKGDATVWGIVIEMIRRSKYVHADIDSMIGRIAMLMKKPLITHREELDIKYLSPLNPYSSIVIGCANLREGIQYLEKRK